MRRRWGMVARTVAMTSAIAALAVIIAGVVAYPLLRSSALTQAHASLARMADLTASALTRDVSGPGRDEPLPASLAQALQAEQVTGYLVMNPDDAVPGLAPEQVAQIFNGGALSAEGHGPNGMVLIEGRGVTPTAGVVLEQPTSVVGQITAQLLWRIGLALALGLAIAIAVGVVAARRITRQLRAARDAANEMARGEREVHLIPDGPAEVADISEALIRLDRALAISEGRQREFLLSVSHELRTPLTAVKGYSEAMAEGIITGDEVERTASTLVQEAARLDRLVSDLLDLARMGAVNFAITPVETDLGELVEEAGQVWSGRCAAEGVELRLEIPQVSVNAVVDPLRTRQILDNLAENALRVSPVGSVIVLAAASVDDRAGIQVRDSGPGLSPDDVTVAFEPGVLHERYRGLRLVGTGLGLALVGRLATSMGGEAAAGSAPEGGACFTVTFPETFPESARE